MPSHSPRDMSSLLSSPDSTTRTATVAAPTPTPAMEFGTITPKRHAVSPEPLEGPRKKRRPHWAFNPHSPISPSVRTMGKRPHLQEDIWGPSRERSPSWESRWGKRICRRADSLHTPSATPTSPGPRLVDVDTGEVLRPLAENELRSEDPAAYADDELGPEPNGLAGHLSLTHVPQPSFRLSPGAQFDPNISFPTPSIRPLRPENCIFDGGDIPALLTPESAQVVLYRRAIPPLLPSSGFSSLPDSFQAMDLDDLSPLDSPIDSHLDSPPDSPPCPSVVTSMDIDED